MGQLRRGLELGCVRVPEGSAGGDASQLFRESYVALRRMGNGVATQAPVAGGTSCIWNFGDGQRNEVMDGGGEGVARWG